MDISYFDTDYAEQICEENRHNAKKAAYKAFQKKVLLAKNHDKVLSMKKGIKAYIECLKKEDTCTFPMRALVSCMGVIACIE